MSETETTAPAAATETPAPTLDDVYSEFQVQPAGQTPPAESTPTHAAPPLVPAAAPVVPDPVTEPDQYRVWIAQQQQAMDSRISGALEGIEAEQARLSQERINVEVNQVVDQIHAGLEGVSKRAVKADLALRYAEDPRFQQLFANRATSPAAWQKASKVIQAEIAKEFSAKLDPQTAEDQRAMTESMHAAPSGRSAEHDRDRKLLEMSTRDFNQEWQKIVRRG